MTRLLLLLWLVLASTQAAPAQPVRVTSGEHDGFTRLVLDYGIARDWQVGRTTDGYELRLTDARPAYDLTGVYDLIGRGRLASVWADPETGALRIGIGCACHAQPFEFRPGIVVIDFRDGPPPGNSVFEQSLAGGDLPRLESRPVRRPRARPGATADGQTAAPAYDWTTKVLRPETTVVPTDRPIGPTSTPDAVLLPDTDPGLQPLRDALLHHLSRGAARGIVDMARPQAQPDAPVAAPDPASVRVRLSDLPGVRIDDASGAPRGVTANGASCIEDAQLPVQDWGTDRPVAEQISVAMAGLMGEFDVPDPQATVRALRFLLFIGFGAEARQLLAQLPAALPDAAIFNSLAHIMDATPDPAPAFAGMAACDTAAALWALLGNPAPEPGTAFDRATALRSFSALPLHLRRHLGPALAARFVSLDDAAAAAAVRDAILRAPGEAGPDVSLMEARLDLDAGEPALAEQRIETLIAQSGPATPEALIALVETRLAQRKPVEPDQIVAIAGLLHERRNTPDAARYAKALTLAQALAGDFDTAISGLDATSQAAAEVWRLLAELGPDSALLTHAVPGPGAELAVAPEVARQLASRLSALGFPAAARRWLDPGVPSDQVLSVSIALQEQDGRAALRLMAGSDDPGLLPLRIKALRQLGDEATLAATLGAAGDETGRWNAVARARDWAQLASGGPAPWRAVAGAAMGAGPVDVATDAGPLTQGQSLLQDSEATRQAVADLLSGVPGPAPSGS